MSRAIGSTSSRYATRSSSSRVRGSSDGSGTRWIRDCRKRDPLLSLPDMETSARNQLKGKIKKVTPGAVMGEVVVDVGGQEVVAMISKASIERLRLAKGDAVVAIIKSTDVMIGK